MLGFLRSGGKRTKVIWWALTIVTVVTFLGGFVFIFGSGLGSSGARSRGEVGLVDGQPITYQEYENARSTQLQAFRARSGADPSEQEQKDIERQAWQSLVIQRLLDRQARRVGIGVSDKELVTWLRALPPAQLQTNPELLTNGQFDMAKYQALALSNPNFNWAPFEQERRRELPAMKLEQALQASYTKFSEPEVREVFRERFERVNATLVEVQPDRAAKVPPPAQADLDRAYAQYPGFFVSGPRLDLEVMMVPKRFHDEDVRAARQLAQDLVGQIRRGASFDSLARSYSEGPGAQQGGTLNRVFQAAELGAVGQQLAAMQPGQVTDPMQDASRFRILKLVDRVPDPTTGASGLKLAMIEIPIRGNSDDQRDSLLKLRARAVALKSLGSAATERGFTTGKTGAFDPNSMPPVLAQTPEAVDWATGTKVGDISPLFMGQDAFILVQTAMVHAGGRLPRESAEDNLRQLAELLARVDLAKPKADQVAQAVARGQSLEDAAKAAGLAAFSVTNMTRAQPDPRLGGAVEVVGALFSAPAGKVLGPLRLPSGWYFARLDQKTPAPADSTFERIQGQIIQQLVSNRQRTFYNGWLSDQRMKGKVEDLRFAR